MKKRIIKVISTISILIIILLGYYFLNKYFSISIPCIFNKITGYLCPGCGITRCLFSLIEGNYIEAFYYNQLISILIIPFIIISTINIINYILDLSYIKIPKIIINALLIITLLFGIIRNIL